MLKQFSKERIFYIFMTFLIAIIIFLFSNIPTPVGEKTGLNLATLYHFGAFFMFAFFLSLTLITKKLDTKKIAIVLLISLAYALSDEFHQLFVPGRFCSLKDVLVDLIGSSCAVLTIKAIESYKKL
jgi:VanZ family protein